MLSLIKIKLKLLPLSFDKEMTPFFVEPKIVSCFLQLVVNNQFIPRLKFWLVRLSSDHCQSDETIEACLSYERIRYIRVYNSRVLHCVTA